MGFAWIQSALKPVYVLTEIKCDNFIEQALIAQLTLRTLSKGSRQIDLSLCIFAKTSEDQSQKDPHSIKTFPVLHR